MSDFTDACKQDYLSFFKDGPLKHRAAAQRLAWRYSGVSAAALRDQMIVEGYIRLVSVKKKLDGNYIRTYGIYEMTGKKFKAHVQPIVQTSNNPFFWEDGTPKSKGNAFNWRGIGSNLFTKAELANMRGKVPSLAINDPVGSYLRA